jgi:hypothetical protein
MDGRVQPAGISATLDEGPSLEDPVQQLSSLRVQ